MNHILIESFESTRPWFHPGDQATVEAVLSAATAVTVPLCLTLLDLDAEIVTVEGSVEIGPAPRRHRFELALPDAPRHGYGLRLLVGDGDLACEAACAVEALDGWWQSPRHAAMTEYADAEAAAGATRELASRHVNVVQHYDWMWRHYRYRPPDGASEFKDALGRMVSHEAVHASIEAGHEAGIAALAYGSVYGAEPEHVARHPEDRVYDQDGEPLSLGGAFFINDIRPGSAWRTRLLREYVDAIGVFGFDGIHMDTYGPPHTAVSADGEAIDFASLYPGLIEEAAMLVAEVKPGARVLFNCVEGFPLAAVAAAPAAALYLELWPPDRSFRDVVGWIDRARAVAAGRQVVIAAYAATLKDAGTATDRAAAVEPSLLLGAVIAAAGAYHHTLAEGDRLLVEGYYPAAVRMTPPEIVEFRALWSFTARYVHLLSDPESMVVEPSGLAITDIDGTPVSWSSSPCPARYGCGQSVIATVGTCCI